MIPEPAACQAAAVAGDLLPHALASAPADLPDVYFWGVIDWHFRYQRPQHLATAFAARGHRVFYVSNRLLDTLDPAVEAQPLDASGRLFQVRLALTGAPEIYAGAHTPPQLAQLQTSLARLLAWTRTESALSIVQHAFWTDLASMIPNARLIYDCLDHQPGFDENHPALHRAEERLLGMADLVIASSAWIAQGVQPYARSTTIVRNGSDHAHFSRDPGRIFTDARKRKVIGYYGAIEAWFDLALVREVALAHADALVVLIGLDRIGAEAALADLPNVRMLGEVPYRELPYWLYGFDVCLMPFRVVPLTLATNPVKIYEYLSAGKPVVAVDLPEMTQFGHLVRVAGDSATFVAAVGDALERPGAQDEIMARRSFAAANTWTHRAREYFDATDDLDEPKISVVVLTHDNLALTQTCLESVEALSDYANLEIIVVDNASAPETRRWLLSWSKQESSAGHVRRLIVHPVNAGFAAGNNLGLQAATGEFLILLNNDTRVTRGWVRTLCSHLRRDPRLGIVGPVTDNIGNEARIELVGTSAQALRAAALAYTRARPGGEYPLSTAAFFCAAMPRAVYQVIGPLDESYGLGFFEDDDYCRRVQLAHYRIACAEDVVVHHHLSASFDLLGMQERNLLFERNRRIYESKWGPWIPHAHRRVQGSP